MGVGRYSLCSFKSDHQGLFAAIAWPRFVVAAIVTFADASAIRESYCLELILSSCRYFQTQSPFTHYLQSPFSRYLQSPFSRYLQSQSLFFHCCLIQTRYLEVVPLQYSYSIKSTDYFCRNSYLYCHLPIIFYWSSSYYWILWNSYLTASTFKTPCHSEQSLMAECFRMHSSFRQLSCRPPP